MTTKGMRLRLGLLVLLAGGLLAALVVMFGSLPRLFKRTTTYTVRFADAPGLTPGAPVRRSGVKVGSVASIELDEEKGIVRVKILLDHPYTIRKSEQVTLTAGLLGNDAGIDLFPREAEDKEELDRSSYVAHSEIIGVRAASVNTLIQGASDVVPTTQQTLNEIRKSLERLEKLANRAEKTIPIAEETLRTYRDLGNDTRKLVPEFQKTNLQVQALLKQTEGVIPEIQKTNKEYADLATDVRKAIPEVMKTNAEYAALAKDARGAIPEILKTNKLISDSIQNLTPAVTGTLEEYRALAADVRKAIPVLTRNAEDAGAAARNVGRLAERADVLLQTNQEKIEKSLDNLNKTLERAALVISDDNVRHVNNLLSNVSKASDKLPALTNNADELSRQAIITLRRLDETLRKVDSAVTDVQGILRPLSGRSERMAKNADDTLQKANAFVTDLQSRGGTLFKSLDETTGKVNLILDDIRALLKAIDKADGSFRKFLTDPSLYNNVDSAIVNAMKLLPRVERILKDVETFADKLARHPELIGVGGAVRPSDGLKSPATPPIGSPPPGGHPSMSPKR